MFINSLLCSTDTSPAVLITVAGENYASHNYDLNVGSKYPLQEVLPTSVVSPFGVLPNGDFFKNRGVKPSEFIDGTSNTVAAAETIRSNQNSTYATDPTRVFLVTGNNTSTGPPLTSNADYATYYLSLPSATIQFQTTKGVRWHYSLPGHSMYNHRRVPNDQNPDCCGGLQNRNKSDPEWSYPSLNVTTRSNHPGGVQALMADGHVQFIKNSINLATWQALRSRNGGEVISSDSY
jgi:prepilin-type processing-associated H-X9-DG protein